MIHRKAQARMARDRRLQHMQQLVRHEHHDGHAGAFGRLGHAFERRSTAHISDALPYDQREATRGYQELAVRSLAGLRETVAWYRENEWWWRPVKERDPQFKAYYESQYGNRG